MAWSQSYPPSCYGKEHKVSPHCGGGLDPTFVHPDKNTHRRDPCRWQESCQKEMMGSSAPFQINKKPRVAPPVVPQPQFARPPQPPYGFVNSVKQAAQPRIPQPPPMFQPQMFQQPVYQQPVYQQPVYQQPVQQQAPTFYPGPQQFVPYHAAYQHPQHIPMNYQSPGSQMPGYLAVPEPMQPGVGFFKRLFVEVFRSMAKGAFHTGANYMDHTPFIQYLPPQPVQQFPPQSK